MMLDQKQSSSYGYKYKTGWWQQIGCMNGGLKLKVPADYVNNNKSQETIYMYAALSPANYGEESLNDYNGNRMQQQIGDPI